MREARSALIGALVAALLMMALPSGAASGDNVILGQNNDADVRTNFTGPGSLGVSSSKSVRIRSNRTPLTLLATNGDPPLDVDSDALVDQLNVDEVDGYDAAGLVRSIGDKTENVGSVAAIESRLLGSDSLNAPGDGFLQLSGGFSADGAVLAGIPDASYCWFEIDGSVVDESVRQVGSNGTCHARVQVSLEGNAQLKGLIDWDVEFVTDYQGTIGAAAFWGVLTPFDGGGSEPESLDYTNILG